MEGVWKIKRIYVVCLGGVWKKEKRFTMTVNVFSKKDISDSTKENQSFTGMMIWSKSNTWAIQKMEGKMSIMCKYGFHKWKYFRMSIEYIKAFPEGEGINRRCILCGRMEITDDGLKWLHRI
jgi:hypothetical protein